MDMRKRIREQTALATTYADDGAYLSAARILLETAAEAMRHGTAIMAPTPAPVEHLGLPPAIVALATYAAAAPAEKTDEGYWDDMEAANVDGQRQESSEAAWLMRDALKALGIEPPAGLPVCKSCGGQSGEDGWHYHDCDIADCPPEMMEATDANA